MLRTSPNIRANDLIEAFCRVRQQTLEITDNLEMDDFGLQNHPDCSPPKWHLAHTTWFFEEMILRQFIPDYKSRYPFFSALFNSYYESLNLPVKRFERRHMSRPSLKEVMQFRAEVDERLQEFLLESNQNHPQWTRIAFLSQLGVQHEQQHQELLYMDILYNFFSQALQPALWKTPHTILHTETKVYPVQWINFEEGVFWFGAKQSDEFCYDNEEPAHRRFLNSFQISNRLVSNQEYQNFLDDDGYKRPEFWLSDGWQWKKDSNRDRPLYWGNNDYRNYEFSLFGWRPLRPENPVCHLSFFEADAYAKWARARLPNEFEWEMAAKSSKNESLNLFLESEHFMALPADRQLGLQQTHGPLWQWTQSSYEAYPGYLAFHGALGEYNSKFMCNQFVLRGGSWATPQSHYRPSYRNYFYPHQSWAFTGLRLARDLAG